MQLLCELLTLPSHTKGHHHLPIMWGKKIDVLEIGSPNVSGKNIKWLAMDSYCSAATVLVVQKRMEKSVAMSQTAVISQKKFVRSDEFWVKSF